MQKAQRETSAAAYPTKYRPDYPQRFESIEHARIWSRHFVDWYNHQHRHSSLGLMTPAIVHAGLADQVSAQRQQVLQAAYEKHPQRFVAGIPVPPQVPDAVWINPPSAAEAIEVSSTDAVVNVP